MRYNFYTPADLLLESAEAETIPERLRRQQANKANNDVTHFVPGSNWGRHQGGLASALDGKSQQETNIGVSRIQMGEYGTSEVISG